MIAAGESTQLEFKSSLRWNYRAGIIDTKMEEIIMKSIAALSNSDGGTLLIGVADDGEILGLEKNYTSLNADKDKFEVHLRNLINQYFGKPFGVRDLEITFPELEGTVICRMDVSKGKSPQYITVADTNGQKTEKFYVRSGNTSQEFKPSEALEYIQTQF